MYNTKHLSQIEKFSRHLGLGERDISEQEAISEEAARNYVLPQDIKRIPCRQDTNGEWVADSDNSQASCR